MIELKELEDVCKKIIYNTDLILTMGLDESEVYQMYLKEFRDFIFENWETNKEMNDLTQFLFMWYTFKQLILGIENDEY